MIYFDHVQFTYPNSDTASLSNLSLNVRKGECIVVTGRSGCGKTTMTRLINGLATHFYGGRLYGTLRLNGELQARIPFWAIGRRAGSILQDPSSQFFAEKVRDELAFGCENYGLPRNEMIKRIAAAAEKTGIDDLLDQSLFQLSSGLQQRVAIASIRAIDPDIYVFDEPSANLDTGSIDRLAELMLELKREGKTLFIAEHRLYYLRSLADRFLYMEDGQLIRQMSVSEISGFSQSDIRRLGLRSLRLPDIKYRLTPHKEKKSGHPALDIRDLNFSFKKTPVLSHINLTAGRGDIIAVTGPNGAGKTTLAKAICGLIKEKAGTVLFDGHRERRRARKRKAFFVMQHPDSQLFSESVLDELNLNAANSRQAEELLSAYHLLPFSKKHPSTLSGGQKQRLTLAVAEAVNPEILLLDEPTSGLDGQNMRLIAGRLRMMASSGKTIIVITHDLEFISIACTRVIRLENGKKVRDDELSPPNL
ncbi:ABC transporter ATP-binding protein [Sporolactobacillus sp. THM19-2]|uniref:ABC transporter ATP-binding protein n=1 Tax=Sporolactobacillus sp. THM19-2 TaxID=2511171 RepID=UPI00101F0A83|nr:ABC transporter ATP-binding protein [Sporolactobacillus sp. THM19-2]RYL92619.1 ABC transporter ATP-binding protein [Sporolactobacillus sp. THM19-2]